MRLRTGKTTGCLVNISGGTPTPCPTHQGRPNHPVLRTTSRCVFLTADGLDCMATLERCAWSVSQGLCIRPGAHTIRYREPGVMRL